MSTPRLPQPRPPVAKSESVVLRAWQQEAVRAFINRSDDSFLTVACPGAGKTTFALVAARQWLAGQRRPLVVVVPTQHLKVQWASAALRFGLHLDPAWSASDGAPAVDLHGVVVTYAQAASSAGPLAAYCADGLVVLDEIHHAADDRTWGDGVRAAFGPAACRLLLSGTPFRTDDSPIPFVRYSAGNHGEAIADHEYGYGEALLDGSVVRPVYFPRFDGQMEWVNLDGEIVEAGFADELARREWGARLRTALSPDGDWLRTVLDRAHRKLTELRAVHPDAAGLVIASDHEHARAVVDLLATHGVEARLALSDDPSASRTISEFGSSGAEWIVAVRMISEGVDIPRLRVAVFATTTTTAMFFRQAVGRIARWIPGVADQKAYLYLPDDARLRGHAVAIAEQRRHAIEVRRRRVEDREVLVDRQAGGEEQMSLFAALSSTAIDAEGDGLDPHESPVSLADDLVGFPIDLPPPPPLPGGALLPPIGAPGSAPPGADEPTQSRAQIKHDLREKNAARVREIVARSGLGHREVNVRLNRESGVERVGEATISALMRRLSVADRWISTLRP